MRWIRPPDMPAPLFPTSRAPVRPCSPRCLDMTSIPGSESSRRWPITGRVHTGWAAVGRACAAIWILRLISRSPPGWAWAQPLPRNWPCWHRPWLPVPAESPSGAVDPSSAVTADKDGHRRSRQATVAEFDADTGAGAVLHDNGRREEFPGTAFCAGGLRLLRLGQRVRLDYDAQGPSRVTLITLP